MMLLPSAIPCEGRTSRPLLPRFTPYNNGRNSSLNYIAPEPLAPVYEDTTAYSTPTSPNLSFGLQTTCRALQSLLGVTPALSTLDQQQRNIGTYTRTPLGNSASRSNKKRIIPSPPPSNPRGINKRSRDTYESDSDAENENSMDWRGNDDTQERGKPFNDIRRFSTPKRRRLPGPVHLPFGLERSDFMDLNETFSTPRSFPSSPPPSYNQSWHDQIQNQFQCLALPSTPTYIPNQDCAQDEKDEQEDFWTPLDDAQLVHLVLEKLKLSRRDWNECARVLGAEGEGGSLGKRFKYLVEEGKVGLKMKGMGRGDVREIF